MQNEILAKKLLYKLVCELPRQLILLSTALTNNKITTAQTIAHKLHGTIGFCGFTEIQVVASNLEKSLLAHDLTTALNTIEELRSQIQVVENLDLKQIFNSCKFNGI